MEKAIDIIQDRIIYLTGQITLIRCEDIGECTKERVIESFNDEIMQMKKAQEIIKSKTI